MILTIQIKQVYLFLMIEMIWEYYREADSSNSCLNCEFYWRHMSSEKYDIQDLMNKNDIKKYERGQKLCIKHKEFVFMSWCCGDFLKMQEHNLKLYKKELLNRLKKVNKYNGVKNYRINI